MGFYVIIITIKKELIIVMLYNVAGSLYIVSKKVPADVLSLVCQWFNAGGRVSRNSTGTKTSRVLDKNLTSVIAYLPDSGKLFHALEAATGTARSPMLSAIGKKMCAVVGRCGMRQICRWLACVLAILVASGVSSSLQLTSALPRRRLTARWRCGPSRTSPVSEYVTTTLALVTFATWWNG